MPHRDMKKVGGRGREKREGEKGEIEEKGERSKRERERFTKVVREVERVVD